MRSHVVIGGGITGLAACWYLAKAGHRPLLIEKERRFGGVIHTIKTEGCLIEGGPDSFLAAKPAAMELIRDLGLESDVIGSNDDRRVTFIVKNGRLVPMPDGLMMMVPTKLLPIAHTELFSFGTKLKMGLDYFRRPNPGVGERSAAQFVRDHYGQEAVDYLAEPLLSGVYGGDPEQLSADAVLGTFVDMEKKYGSLTRGTLAMRKQRSSTGPIFLTLKGGMEQLTQAVTVQLAGKVDRRQAAAIAIRKSDAGYEVQTALEKIHAERIVLCTPAHSAAAILKSVDEEIAGLLSQTPYNSSITVALGFHDDDVRDKITGFGFLVPKVERKYMAACTFVKNKFDHRIPSGKAVLRCFLGGSHIGEPDGKLVDALTEEIRTLTGITAKPLFSQVTRWRNAMAQYTLGHQARVSEIRKRLTAHPGLHLAGNAYDGIGIPDCIRTAKEAAAQAG